MGKTERIIFFGSLLLVSVIAHVLIRYFRSKRAGKIVTKSKAETNIIKQPKFYLIVGISGILVFSLIGLYFVFIQKEPMSALIMVIDVLYVPAILFQVNWKIEVNESEFTYRNMWRRKRTFTYDEIEVRKLSRCTRFYKNGKHIVGISYLQDNWDCLQKAISIYKKIKIKDKKTS